MKKDKEIQEEIRAYLKGRMGSTERQVFEQKLAEDQRLREEVEWMQLVLEGITELEKRKVSPKKKRPIRALPVLMILLLILSVIGFSILFRKKHALPPEGEHAISPSAALWQADQSIIISGNFWGPHKLGRFSLVPFGKRDGFLASYLPGEGYQWVKTFGSPGLNDRFSGISLDEAGNILLAGTIGKGSVWNGRAIATKGNDNQGERDFFVAKLSPSGDLIWMDHHGGVAVPDLQTGDNLGFAVSSAPGEKVVATATYIGAPVIQGDTLPPGGPNEDVLLYQYDASGQVEWYHSITGDYMLNARALHVDQAGFIYLTGFFGHHNLGGTARFDSVRLNSYGGRDIFLARYSPGGRLDWVKQAGAAQKGNDYGQSITTDRAGNVLVTGWIEGTAIFDTTRIKSRGGRDGFVASYSHSGKLNWVSSFGGKKKDVGSQITADHSGNYYLVGKLAKGKAEVGQSVIEIENDNQGFLAKLNSQGKLLWLKTMKGDVSFDSKTSANALATDDLGNCVIAGTFSGTLEIEGNRWESKGKEDLFILWLDPEGNFLRLEQVPVV